MENVIVYRDNDTLQHHGIKGQKWGLRRFQNPDGTLTEEGKRHYGRVMEGASKNPFSNDSAGKRAEYASSSNMLINQQAYMGNKARLKGKEGKAREYMSAALANAKDLQDPEQVKKDVHNLNKAAIPGGIVAGVGGGLSGLGGLALAKQNLAAGLSVIIGGTVASSLLARKVSSLSLNKSDPGREEAWEKVRAHYANMPIEKLYKEFDSTFVESMKNAETYKNK